MVDGTAVRSCLMFAVQADGHDLRTVEGLAKVGELHPLQTAFMENHGLQCGFCIPGIVVRAHAQIEKKGADLTRADMSRHLGAHLCRCTGYTKILDAIDALGSLRQWLASVPIRARFTSVPNTLIR